MGQWQRTIKREIRLKGVGLHTGRQCEVILSPAPENSGIRFIDLDNNSKLPIPAILSNVIDTYRGTTLSSGGCRIFTVEHLLASLFGLEVDNVLIAVQGQEPPALDGSGKPFCEAILDGGIVDQKARAETLRLACSFELEKSTTRGCYLPDGQLKIGFDLQYPGTPVGIQRFKYHHSPKDYIREIAPARTFGFQAEVDFLHSRGLALGGSLDNAIIITNDRILNQELRFPDEFVRHKILDVMGDLCLLGQRIEGFTSFVRSGHTFNVAFAKQLQALYNGSRKVNLENTVLNFEQIQEIIPHRYPMLLLDKVVYLDDRTVTAVKNVTGNEEFFKGHFPGKAVMPGVLIVEALAQAAGVLMLNKEEHRGKIPYFTGINDLRLRKPVMPGDTLQLEVTVLKVRGNTGKVRAIARVNNKEVVEGELMFALDSRSGAGHPDGIGNEKEKSAEAAGEM